MTHLNRSIVAFLFVFSGLTSLVYESLWIRTLGLSLGSTSTSMSLVLSIFFFGMSLGSVLTAQWIDQIKNPLKTYGILEGVIGLYSLGLIYILTNLSGVVTYLPGNHSSSLAALAIKAVVIFLILGPPTVAMGSTLPLLIKALSSPKISVGKNVSILYAINTLGAVLGAYASGFVLIPNMGLYGSNHLMVAFNLLIFIFAFTLSHKKNFQSPVVISNKKSVNFKISSLNHTQKAVLASAGLVGLASIGSEVIWNKYLNLFLGTNIFGLSLILSIFLFGIALGSFLLSLVIEKIQNKINFYINLLTLTIASILLSTWALNWAPVISNIVNYYVQWMDLLTIKSLFLTMILSVPTSLFGALLPLAVHLLTENNENAAAVTGKVYAVNTWGAILGSTLTGLWLIPTFGSAVSLIILNVILLFALLAVISAQTSEKIQYFSFAKVILVILMILNLPSIKFDNIIKSAYYSYVSPGQSFSDVTKFFTKDFEKIVFLAEGKTAIISLNEEINENGEMNSRQLRMKTNGLNESYYDRDFLDVIPKYEGLLGLVPYLHHKNPRSAFIVGYGGGYSTDVLTSLPLALVHVAEIEESILKAADFIYEGNNPIMKRKNLKLEIEDARFVLNAKKHGPYDIIVSQPSHSWVSGAANLFTQDFFEMAKGNLKKGGVFAQWLNLYNMDLGSLKSILSTYYKTFPYGVVYTDQTDYQVILLGSMEPIKLDFDRLKKLASDAEWQRKLTFLPMDTPYDFLSSFSMGREQIIKTTLGAPINTDENAYAEIRQSRLFYNTDSETQAAQPYFSENFDVTLGGTLNLSEDEQIDVLFNLLKSLGRQEKCDKYFKLAEDFENRIHRKKKYRKALAELCNGIESN